MNELVVYAWSVLSTVHVCPNEIAAAGLLLVWMRLGWSWVQARRWGRR